MGKRGEKEERRMKASETFRVGMPDATGQTEFVFKSQFLVFQKKSILADFVSLN